ncbi:hypothetical protein FACS1894110_15850 [Spirochaetia bacterium]|nr:hypothetical protein FACS1894110_15850 [Spirochaetia bacterium]
MKNNKFFMQAARRAAGMLAQATLVVALTFGLVLAGCDLDNDPDGGGGDPPPQPTAVSASITGGSVNLYQTTASAEFTLTFTGAKVATEATAVLVEAALAGALSAPDIYTFVPSTDSTTASGTVKVTVTDPNFGTATNVVHFTLAHATGAVNAQKTITFKFTGNIKGGLVADSGYALPADNTAGPTFSIKTSTTQDPVSAAITGTGLTLTGTTASSPLTLTFTGAKVTAGATVSDVETALAGALSAADSSYTFVPSSDSTPDSSGKVKVIVTNPNFTTATGVITFTLTHTVPGDNSQKTITLKWTGLNAGLTSDPGYSAVLNDGSDSGGTFTLETNSGPVPNVVSITGITDALKGMGGVVLGVFPTGTTLAQATIYTGLIAGADSAGGSAVWSGTTNNNTLTAYLHTSSDDAPWTGNGTYDVYVLFNSTDARKAANKVITTGVNTPWAISTLATPSP